MRSFVNSAFNWYYKLRYKEIERILNDPHTSQREIFQNLIHSAKNTEFGRLYGFDSIRTPEQFRQQVPVLNYELLKPYIDRMMEGEKDILWPGRVEMYSKSSGTTSAKSKFIPVSQANFDDCHIKGSWDTMTIIYNELPDCTIFSGKNFIMAGNHSVYKPGSKTIYGDVSALMIKNMPKIAKPFLEPDLDIVFRDDWESKIQMMAEVACRPDVAPMIKMIGGVPTWTIVFFRHVLEHSGKSNMLEVWPNFEVYIHGGVNIEPYREQFAQILPSEQVKYFEVYNASEGYFGTKLNLEDDDMLLLVNNGVYYEFLPMDQWHEEYPKAIPLEEVEVGKNYALVISTNAGLWRYLIGDTVTFTSVNPYKIKITGRTKQFVNAFGEEVMVANTDKAITQACQELDAIVSEYTVAPIYFKNSGKGGHEWLVEFEKEPTDLEAFNSLLDRKLQSINSDYEAKRYKDMALQELILRRLPKGTFLNWMKQRGKLGNQNKVPRLANNRQYVEDILNFLQEA
jgi:hypothetical protein